jgi:patatin-related protein
MDKPEFHREFRLGLVVYGGVSLAVYMNGVCREFYNAVRGRGIYKLIKALTDSDIVVDIISGTSAGGINGVLLSYALTNSSKSDPFEFEDFASVWRDSGDINGLLRKVKSSGDVNSILDGEGYYQEQLAGAFQSVWEKSLAKKDKPKDDWFSPFEELDLFVTGTDVIGKVERYFDNTGKVIEVNDHHTVFRLKHRQEDPYKNPFKPNLSKIPQKSLAKLCRITSCFPVAFPVVTVRLDSPSQDIDAKLVEWGQLKARDLPPEKDTEDGYQLHFVDGGVLDNRPFSYTIQEIYYRKAYRPVDRKLFYIDPSPDKFLDSPSFQKMAKPNIWESAIDSLVSLPRYESIAGDLAEIRNKNDKVRRYKFLRATAESIAEKKLLEDAQQTSPAIDPENHPEHPNGLPSDEEIYLRCRLVGLRDRVLPLLVGFKQVTNSDTENPLNKDRLEKIAELLTSYFSDQEKQKARENFLHKTGKEIINIDIEYALRKQFYILEKIIQYMEEEKYITCHQPLENLARYLNRLLDLLEVIQVALDLMLTQKQVCKTFNLFIQQAESNDIDTQKKARAEIYFFLLRLHRFLLDEDGLSSLDNGLFFKNLPSSLPNNIDNQPNHWLSSTRVTEVFDELKERAAQLNDLSKLDREQEDSIWQEKYKFVQGSKNDSDRYCSILKRIEETSLNLILQLKNSAQGKQPLQKVAEKIETNYRCFRYIDQQVYPFEYLADIKTKDLIQIARISPDDAQRGFGYKKKLEERLAGIQLGAFGGFFKKSWRSNDILWGRLDGLNRLVDCLLTPETVQNFRKFIDRQIAINSTPVEDYISQLVTAAFPQISPEDKNAFQDDLKQLYDGSLSRQDFQKFLNKLVEVGQLSILQTDLKNVFNDAIAEQFTWNQQLLAPPPKKKTTPTTNETNQPPIFSAIDGYFDRVVTPFNTQSLAKSSLQEILDDPDKTKDYFKNKYRVGSERIKKDIPPLILDKLLARSGLVVRNILLSKPTGGVLSKSVTFQFVNRLLQTFYVWVEANDPSTSFVPKVLRPLLSWIGVIALVVGTAFVVSQIPLIFLIAIITLLIAQLVYSVIGPNKWIQRSFKTIALVLVLVILASPLVGLPLPHRGAIALKRLFSDRCPLIETPWTVRDCQR